MSAGQRKNSVAQLRAIRTALGEVSKGGVVPSEIRGLTAKLIRGGEMQERLVNLGVPIVPVPATSPGLEAQGAALLLNAVYTVSIDFLPTGCCGVPLPSMEGKIIKFCKGACTLNEEDDTLVCELCDTPQGASCLRYAEGLFAVAIQDTEEEGAGKGEAGIGKLRSALRSARLS